MRKEAIAGQAYQAEEARRAKGLPDLKQEKYVNLYKGLYFQARRKFFGPNTKADDYVRLRQLVHDYARDTFTSPRTVWKRMKANRGLPTNILGVKVESSSGEVWGALVMDSSNPYVCIDTRTPRFQRAWKVLRERLIQCGAVD